MFKLNYYLCRVLAVVVSISASQLSARASLSEANLEPLLPLHVCGTSILDAKDRPVLLRGVNAASMEFTSDGEGHILQTVEVAVNDWHVNILRLPLAQDRWFGKAPEQTDGGKSYRALVHQIADYCATNRCYIVLDLHWSDCGEWGKQIGQHSMPDANSVAFWKCFAPEFANRPEVIFDLYNEPHDVSWNVWLNGGTIKDKPNNRLQMHDPKTFRAVGMQLMLDTVRETGAKNLVIVGGLDWAYDFSGILSGHILSDRLGNGVIFANHCYDNKNQSVSTWIKNMEAAARKLPIIVSEFGGQFGPGTIESHDNWLLHVMRTLDEKKWSWIAWDLHPQAGPALITDWNYTPSPQFGVYVKKLLRSASIGEK